MTNPPSQSLTAPPILLPVPFAYIVNYELYSFDKFDYSSLYAELQSSPDWFHYMTNTWIVMRREPMILFNNLLSEKISKQDRLLIMPAKGPAMGILPPEAWNWLNKNLRREW